MKPYELFPLNTRAQGELATIPKHLVDTKENQQLHVALYIDGKKQKHKLRDPAT